MNEQMKHHWEHVYGSRPADSMSWFQEHASPSMQLIGETGADLNAPIIDIGGGASRLVDDLHAAGYTDLTVMDVSSAALEVAKDRLGPEIADTITWIEADITEAELPSDAYEVWHDRAVFHFLTSGKERQRYVERMRNSVRHGGWAIIATFAEDGPERCSGLPVVRYRPDTLSVKLGSSFILEKHVRDSHTTPSGSVQQFVYCTFRRL
jgi:SAM-dependent methyltransferase